MIKTKEDKKTIYEILIFIIVYILVLWTDRSYKNYISFSFLALIIASWLYNLHSKIQYKKGNSNYLFVPSENDKYFRNASVVIGTALLIFTLIYAFITKNFNHIKIVTIITGAIVVLNGLFYLPKGMIKIKSNFIDITGLKHEIDQNDLLQIEILSTRIIITDIHNEKIELDDFNIDKNLAELIENYIIANRTNSAFHIINRFKTKSF